MKFLNRIAVFLWIILFLSAAVFFILALLAPETQLFDAKQKEEWISLVKTTTDIDRLRNIAANIITLGWATGSTAIWLCRLSIITLLVIVCGAIFSLFQIKRMKKELNQNSNTPGRDS